MGARAAAAGRHDDAVEQLGQALALWRDRPFEDIADLSIGQAPAARLNAIREAAIAIRLESLLGGGHIDVAAAELESLVVAEPLVERWWALLMIALYRQDRQADAFRAYQQARTVLADELGLDPGPELRDLEAKILQQDPSLGPSSRNTYARPEKRNEAVPSAAQLPKRLASFVGRADHIDLLAQLLEHERLVTILGPGGAGKTSIAIEVGRRISCDSNRRRVALIELASLPRGGDVIGAAAAVLAIGDGDLRVTVGPATDMERIIDTIGNREILLIVDNCEHVIVDARDVRVAVAAAVPAAVTILATSREPLAVAGEQLWAIPPLTADEAIELLAVRAEVGRHRPVARRRREQTVATTDRAPRRVATGHRARRGPTAASCPSTISVAARRPLHAAVRRAAIAEPRQQTLRGLVDWSHDLLDEPSESSSGGWRCSAAARRWRRSSTCAPTRSTWMGRSGSGRLTSTDSSADWSTSRWSQPTEAGTAFASACCRRCRTTPPNG